MRKPVDAVFDPPTPREVSPSAAREDVATQGSVPYERAAEARDPHVGSMELTPVDSYFEAGAFLVDVFDSPTCQQVPSFPVEGQAVQPFSAPTEHGMAAEDSMAKAPSSNEANAAYHAHALVLIRSIKRLTLHRRGRLPSKMASASRRYRRPI